MKNGNLEVINKSASYLSPCPGIVKVYFRMRQGTLTFTGRPTVSTASGYGTLVRYGFPFISVGKMR